MATTTSLEVIAESLKRQVSYQLGDNLPRVELIKLLKYIYVYIYIYIRKLNCGINYVASIEKISHSLLYVRDGEKRSFLSYFYL